ncbi:histidine kinase [Nocardia sp. NPDC050712]|uniref:sensor histidine kinase n=1 Tax=Nocardia sp. NPDC050712 TaxID=3155518 RepID=UPI0033F24E5A
MKYSALLAITAAGGALNGLAMDGLPAWRQLLFALLFAAAYFQGRRLPERHGGPIVLVALAASALVVVIDVAEAVGAVMSLALFVALPWVVGRFRRQQAELLAVGQERIRHLEQTQELAADSARLRERARIATDMHDSLGHELALIALQAGALELSTELAEPNRQAASRLRASAVTASDELRRTVSVLRADTVEGVEPPSMSVDALIARARTAGMMVDLVDSEPRGDLPPLVESAVRRVVQETLTNAARHAPGAGVRIEIERRGDELGLVVTNPIATSTAGSDAEADATASSASFGVKTAGAGRDSKVGGGVETAVATPGVGPEWAEPAVGIGVGARGIGGTGRGGGTGGKGHGVLTGSDGRGAGTGSGLLGLAARVQLLGGTFRVDDGHANFTVVACIPVTAPVRAGAR